MVVLLYIFSKEPSEEHRIAPATATRYLILVRHGQYHTGARTEEEKTLTTLGNIVI